MSVVYGVYYVNNRYGDNLIKIFSTKKAANAYRHDLQRVHYLTEGDEKIYQVKTLPVEDAYEQKPVKFGCIYEVSVPKYNSYGLHKSNYSTYSYNYVPTIIDRPYYGDWEKSEVSKEKLSDLPYPGKNKIFVACKFNSDDLHGVNEYRGTWDNGFAFSHCLQEVEFFRFSDYKNKARKQLYRYIDKYKSILKDGMDRTNPFYYISKGFKPLLDYEEFDLGYRRVLRYLNDKGYDFDDIKTLPMEKIVLMTNLNVWFFSQIHVFYKDIEFKPVKKHGLMVEIDDREWEEE